MVEKFAKPRIMYIEDEVDALSTMVEFLKLRGFDVEVSYRAEEAYGLLKSWNPDILLIDITLIGASGIDFVERIQKEGIDTPVIIITAHPKRIVEIEARGLNIRNFYEKPFSYDALYKTIKEILEGR